MKRIAVVTGSRAEYGILYPLMKKIKSCPKFKLLTLVVGMHFSSEFGNTINEIRKDGFSIDGKVCSINTEDTNADMARYLGKVIIKAVDVLDEIKPDCIILLGDRVDILAMAMAASYMNVVIAHISGGDITGSGLDEPARHAITKFAHLHFAATKKSAQRIIKMGEEPWRVFVAAPELDSILDKKLFNKEEISKRYNLDLSKPILLVVQHAVTTESHRAKGQIRETLEAIRELKYQTILIYPNADAGGRSMIKVIKKYERYPFIKAYKTLPHKEYLGLMNIVSVIVGNSSSGIVEAPSFRLPAVNIGTRQEGRERAKNVIDAGYNKEETKCAIKKALYDNKFKEKVNKCKSPYEHGKTSEMIVSILKRIRINKKLLQKSITF